MRAEVRTPPPRPAAVDVAAAILVFGGLFGFSQVTTGDYLITGSLPAKDPIVGVALIAYAASVGLGIAVRIGRAWLAAVNFAAVVALLYLPAMERPLILTLVLAHALAAIAVLVNRPWFTAMAAWRAAPWDTDPTRPGR